MRGSTAAVLLVTILIVVGGGVVRVTGSGLGCPDWPSCTGNSFTSAAATTGVHGLIEFVNRLLTGVVGFVVLAVIAAVWREQLITGVRRRALWWSAVMQLLVVLLNAVVGGVTVLTGLNPYIVAVHFLAAVLLLTATAISYDIAHRRVRVQAAHPSTTGLARVVAGLGALLVVLGAVLTGAGPHPGDSGAVARIPLNWTLLTIAHGALATVVLIAAGLCAVAAGRHGDSVPRRRALTLIVVLVAQGALGVYQSVNGLPPIAVVLHLMGAALVWIGVTRLLLAAPPHHLVTAMKAEPRVTFST